MIIKIKCTECNNDLLVDVVDNKIVSVQKDRYIYLSDDEIANILSSMNIELGVVKGGENK